MDRKSPDGLPTIIADTESLRQQLRELHASVKAKTAERREPSVSSVGAGMVIRGEVTVLVSGKGRHLRQDDNQQRGNRPNAQA